MIRKMTVKEYLSQPKKNRPKSLFLRRGKCCSMEICEGNVTVKNEEFLELEFISVQGSVLWAQTVKSGAFIIRETRFLYVAA